MLHPTGSIRQPAAWAALPAALLLASCGGGYGDNFNGYPPIEKSAGVAAADFNSDGSSDIVQLSSVQNGLEPDPATLKTYLSTSATAFAAPTMTDNGDDPLYIATADLNGDLLPDVVTASVEDGALAVYFNNTLSPGTFNTPLVLPSPGASQVAIGDMNGDGLPDLVAADYNVSLFLQTSPGTFANPTSLYPGGANWVAVGNLHGNADNILDVAVVDATGVKVLMHTGAASATTYAAPVAVFTQTLNGNVSGANIVAIADVNGDGLNDLVITDPGPTGGMAPAVNVLLQDPANHGHFLAAVSYPVAAQSLAQSLVVKDLDGDNKLDIVIGGTDAVSILLGNGDGTFQAATNFTAEDANEIAVADVNGDNLPDIIVATGPTQPVVNGVTTAHPGVLLQTAPGTFATLADLP